MYFPRNHTDFHKDEYTDDFLSILYNPHTTDGGTFINNKFYVDKIHVEQRIGDSNIPTYVDGAQGLNYEWTGTANASTSIRRAGLSVIRGFKLVNESSTAADIIYVGLDCDASSTTGIPVLGGQSFETNWPIDFREKVTVLAAQNTPAAHGVIWGIHQG